MVTYTPRAQRIRETLPRHKQTALDTGMAAIAQDPYGSGSSATWSKDRREATIGGGLFVVYQITAAELLVTVVDVLSP
ncbi:hypothetical protein ACFZBU_08275 [Embleya sp. NPDC008237]|uniref:hypothetical protein n=1 Tax=Embleya sp. NPDC008237 TaxID=3363978 RepID=UPI0036E5A215